MLCELIAPVLLLRLCRPYQGKSIVTSSAERRERRESLLALERTPGVREPCHLHRSLGRIVWMRLTRLV